MRLVVLSDIHGNRWALDAVLAAVKRIPPDLYVVLGDLAADGPDPVGTLERLRALPNAVFVQGNTDRYLSDLGALEHPGDEWADLIVTWQWAADCVGSAGRRFLADVPYRSVLDNYCYMVGSPQSSLCYWACCLPWQSEILMKSGGG